MGRKRKQPFPTPDVGEVFVPVPIDRALVEGFVQTFLLKNFDSPKAIPAFHKELWSMCCLSSPYVALAAPRGHAKSTSITLSWTLAAMLFGFRDYALVVSATEALAVKHLQELKIQLTENEELIETFQVHGLSKDNEAELICHVGKRLFCVTARGAEQGVRGVRWRGKRPNLIVIDDLEEDEAVISPVRREKLANWFMNALLPCGSDECLFRVLGTILHLDSLLNGLLNDPMWISKCYRAHAAFDDFTQILWPEKFPEHRLRAIRDSMVRKRNPSGYSQEYLNQPVAPTDRYFRDEWFLPMTPEDRAQPMRNYAAIDFAISQKERADRTAITVAGVTPRNIVNVRHSRAGRWDALEIIDHMFEIHELYAPEIFVAEDDAIRKVLGPFLNAEMQQRGVYLNLVPMRPVKDKIARARGFQARMRADGVRFDKESEWWLDFYNEMSTFPRGIHDDRVDATAWLGQILDALQPAETDEEAAEEEMAWGEFKESIGLGRCTTTGY